MKQLQLTPQQQALFEEHEGLVGRVMTDYNLHGPRSGILQRDDIFQLGRIGLCKAIKAYKPGVAKLGTYAYTVIRNEIFKGLREAKKEQAVASPDFVLNAAMPVRGGKTIDYQDLRHALESLGHDFGGCAGKGVKALILQNEGLSCQEIADVFNSDVRNVAAWMSRARKCLQSRPELLAG